MFYRTQAVISFLILLLSVSISTVSATKLRPSSILPKMATNDDSAVLRELKETIKKQANEIESLKKQARKEGKAPAASHGAHGGGGEPSDDELDAYLHKPFYYIASKRVGWLSIFLCSLSLTSIIMKGFEHTLEEQIELAYFVPLLAGHGGNTGGQSVGTVLSALSAGFVSIKDAPRVIAKEAAAGLLGGLILGSLVGPVSYFVMGISSHVSTVIFCTIPLVSTIAATLGSTIPFACKAVGLDPSVIAAPAMTSFVDVCGLMCYFLIANRVFASFGIKL